jgi:NADPH:quinone reductase-like Zn-dependent oxidoreductase
MKALEVQGSFGLENLKFAERPQPEPGPGEALVRMAAASLNYRDLLMVKGLYNPKQALPLIPCSDGAGEVVAVGEGVSRVEIGDRVITLFSQSWLSGDPARDRWTGHSQSTEHSPRRAWCEHPSICPIRKRRH